MKRKVFILPFDGYKAGYELIKAIEEIITDKENEDLLPYLAYIKLNDGIHNLDIGGPDMVKTIKLFLEDHKVSAGIFLDLKIYDVSATVENVLKKYAANQPEILTVCSQVSAETLIKLRSLLPTTKLAMVSVPTDIGIDECQSRFGQSPEVKIYNDLMNIRSLYKKKIGANDKWSASTEPFDLIVCSPLELKFLKKNLPSTYGFVVPGIRDEWMKKFDEHQKRVTGVREAINSGATYVVMGAQLLKGNTETRLSAKESRKKTVAELEKATGSLVIPGDPLGTLKNCEGFYRSPTDPTGYYLGPLVAYAKKYYDSEGNLKNMVGYVYLNFAKAEQYPEVREYFANSLKDEIKVADIKADVVLGAPMGGILLAGDLGRSLGCKTVFAEKVVTTAANKEKNVREENELVIDRHDIKEGDSVILVEDVTNNFSTTEAMKRLINSKGGKLVAIACAFNRSGLSSCEDVPVISVCDIKFDQYKQDDPMVKDLIAEGKIVMKPKLEWDKLSQAMNKPNVNV